MGWLLDYRGSMYCKGRRVQDPEWIPGGHHKTQGLGDEEY